MRHTIFLLVCICCSAQFVPNDLAQRIELQVRFAEHLPATVKVSVSSLRTSEFANYDSLTITFEDDREKEEHEFLISKDKKILLRLTKMDISKDPYAEAVKKINVKGRPVRGNASGKVTAVMYDDLQCPFCAGVHRTLFPQLLKEYGDRVAFIYKDFPLYEIHPWATHAAVNANCLAAQNAGAYWDFADLLHNNQRLVNSEKDLSSQFSAVDGITMAEAAKFGLDAAKLQSCVKAQDARVVRDSIKEGESLGVNGTPAMFVNGEMIDGVQPTSEFRAAFDRALQDAAASAPTTPGGSGKRTPVSDSSAH